MVLHTAAGPVNFVRTHGGVTDDDEFVIGAEMADQLQGRKLLVPAAPVVSPDPLLIARLS